MQTRLSPIVDMIFSRSTLLAINACTLLVALLAFAGFLAGWWDQVSLGIFLVAAALVQLSFSVGVACPVCGKSVYRRYLLEPGTLGGELTRLAQWFPEACCSKCGTDLD